MKKWIIDYSVRYKDGRIVEDMEKVEATNITVAIALVLTAIIEPLRKDNPEVSDAVIWNAGIVADAEDPANVF